MSPDAPQDQQNRLQRAMTVVMRKIEALPNVRELFAQPTPEQEAA